MLRFPTKTAYICIFLAAISVIAQVRDSDKQSSTLREEGYSAPVYYLVDEDALEGVIDPDIYMLGPGDVIGVNVWGGMEQKFLLTVNPEGDISIPTVGSIEVGGLVLSQAKELVKEATQKVYKSGEITVYLKKLRRFRIPVSGVVPYPGVYDASAADRVSHLLEKAGNLVLEREQKLKSSKESEWELEPLSSSRNILLIHKTGDTVRVDLLMFARNNDLSFNPKVQEGDAIYVPPLSEEISTVRVYGAVRIPGEVEYSKGDSIRDIINICAGFADDARFNEVIVARCLGRTAEYRTYSLDLSTDSPDWDFTMEADDRIFVRSIPDYNLRHIVTITGEVVYPGVYSIVESQTRLSEVIQRAGGFTKEASLSDAEIIRTTQEEIFDPEYERLKLIPVADMGEMEYEYFKTKSREKASVVVDFEALFFRGDSTQDILFRDNDKINIPLQAKTVRVSGQVAAPGLLNWKTGANFLFYIERSGGYTYNARKKKIRVVRAATGTWIKPDKQTLINVGDTIFVPEKPERDYWEIYKDVLLVVTQMATIVLLINTLQK